MDIEVVVKCFNWFSPNFEKKLVENFSPMATKIDYASSSFRLSPHSPKKQK